MTIAASSVEAVTDLTAQHGGLVQCAYVGGETVPGTSSKRHPLYEWGWNHTTLRALRKDESITYLQCGYAGDTLQGVLDLHERYGGAEHNDEVMTHVEWLRLGGRVSAFGLPLVKWSSKERLDQLIAEHNEVRAFATLAVYLAGLRSGNIDAAVLQCGAPIFNPHTFVLEDGGMKQTDEAQLAFKESCDPSGLLK